MTGKLETVITDPGSKINLASLLEFWRKEPGAKLSPEEAFEGVRTLIAYWYPELLPSDQTPVTPGPARKKGKGLGSTCFVALFLKWEVG